MNIAIHIRRMNIFDAEKSNYKQIPGTDVPNNIYSEIITQLKNIYKNCKIHVYSQGNEKDFIFQDHSVELHLNESIETTFIDFVLADVLIIAPSSFSYSAGLLSDGIIYYIDSCHKPLSFWNIVQNYKSTKDRYDFFIKNTSGVRLNIYYDTVIGKFYKETDKNGKEYINIFQYFNS